MPGSVLVTSVRSWHCAELLFHHRKWNASNIQAWLNRLTLLCLCSLSLFLGSDSADSNLSSVKRFWGCIRHYLQGAPERILHYKVKYLNMGLGWKEVFGKPVWNKLNTSPWGVTLKKDDKSLRKIKESSTSLSSLLFWLSLKPKLIWKSRFLW